MVFVISPQLSAPPALLRDEEELAPWHRKRLRGCFSLGEHCRTSPIHDRQLWKEGSTFPSGLTWNCSWFSWNIYPRAPWDKTWWLPHPWGTAPLACCGRGGRASPSLLWGSPPSPATVPQEPHLTAGLSRSLGTLPGPATSSGVLREAGVDGASSLPCRELAG